MKELLINQDAFIEWYFDNDTSKTFFNDQSIVGALKIDGVFTITAQALLDGCGYMPSGIVVDGQEPIVNEDDEVDMEQYDSFKLVKI